MPAAMHQYLAHSTALVQNHLFLKPFVRAPVVFHLYNCTHGFLALILCILTVWRNSDELESAFPYYFTQRGSQHKISVTESGREVSPHYQVSN